MGSASFNPSSKTARCHLRGPPHTTKKKPLRKKSFVVASSGTAEHSERHFDNVVRHDQLAGGLGDDFLDAYARRALTQDKGTGLDLQIGQVGQHLADAAAAGEIGRAH